MIGSMVRDLEKLVSHIYCYYSSMHWASSRLRSKRPNPVTDMEDIDIMAAAIGLGRISNDGTSRKGRGE